VTWIELLKRLWSALQSATRAPDDQIVIGIQEVAPSQAMEMGRIMPAVAEHPTWAAACDERAASHRMSRRNFSSTA